MVQAAEETIKVFENFYKLHQMHIKFTLDTNLSERDVMESMLREILKSESYQTLRVLGEGDQFGEQALRSADGPGWRTASVKTAEECHLVSIGYDDFWKIVNKIIKGKLERRVEFLKAMPLF